MATKISDIAKEANVSSAAVSLALSGKKGVSPENRSRILQIAKDLKYEHNKIQNLTNQSKNGTLLFLRIARHGHTINRDHDIFIADYIDGLTEGSMFFGYSLVINSFRAIPVSKILESISNIECQGIIILGTELSLEDFSAFSALDIPLIFIDTFQDYIQFDFVDMNNNDGIYKIVNHFVQQGYDNIGFLRTDVITRNFRLRFEAFKDIMNYMNLKIDSKSIITIDTTFDGAYRDMSNYLKTHPKLPDCLVSSNDIMAYGAIKALTEFGIKVPDDISIIGFDNLPLSSIMNPPLTTIKVSKREIGKTAIRLVHNRIHGKTNAPPVKVLIGGELIIRESVKPKN
ncbi:MAG: LacI family DNA-binding transcriptional regulator [Spirochaetaceae bacterium]|nr:LacI family DNA-binding transcriptional regulator [Spirochaetaceae bacterium]